MTDWPNNNCRSLYYLNKCLFNNNENNVYSTLYTKRAAFCLSSELMDE